ncbi:MAG: hypothetical protein LBV33_07160 [Lachnospiraceae bacterium]|jgi:hypothetical protein|nr:hypothetical protein [Lachnospiraceae bacterium]
MEYFYNQNKNHGYLDQPVHPTGQSMAMAALLMGIGALTTCWFFYVSIVFGGLGIIFALLSKGFAPRMPVNGKAGLSISIAGIALSIIILVGSLIFMINNPDILLQLGRDIDDMNMQLYGQSSESILGYSYVGLMEQVIGFFNNF